MKNNKTDWIGIVITAALAAAPLAGVAYLGWTVGKWLFGPID